MQKEVNSDYLLWNRMKAGETKAFNEVYQTYADILFSFGMVYSKDREYVKDCIHDLFFELYKYRKNLSDNDHIRNYLFKSLKRKIQSANKAKLELIYTENIHESGDSKITSDGEDEQEERLEQIRKALTKLSEHQQEVLNLRFQIGLNYAEIARLMDISVESVRTLVYRSVKTIREELHVRSSAVLLFLLTRKTKIYS